VGLHDYATPGQRLAAWLIDALVVNAVVWPVLLLATPLDWGDSDALTTQTVGAICLGIVVALLYLVVSDASASGATIGKRAIGIRVVDSGGQAGPLGYPRALLRRLAYLVGGLALWIGPLWALGDSRRQALHDKAAHTVVVQTS
jgi:uncharacterized RDD family membrane protein YckC